MTYVRRLFAVLLITTLGLVAPATSSAHAADIAAADKAASWVTTQVSGGLLDDTFSTDSGTADGLIGLAAAQDPALQPTIDTLLASAEKGAAAYVTKSGPGAAAKLALVAAAYKLDPRSFGGVDLVAAMKAGINADGSIGATPYVFQQGLVMVALERSGEPVPADTAHWLATQAKAGGDFDYGVDDTAVAILGLLTVDTPEADAAAAKALAWAKDQQNTADGSWAGWVPVNSTAVMGSALLSAGESAGKATEFVASKQLPNGAITDGTGANLMATSQGLLLLGGVSYREVVWSPKKADAAVAQQAPASETDEPKEADPEPASQHTTTSGRGVPAKTGAEDDASPWQLAVGVLALTAAAGVLLRRHA